MQQEKIIDEKGQYCLDFNDKPDDKPDAKSIVEHQEEVPPPVYIDNKGREVPTCPYCNKILHAGAPCER